MHMSRFAQMVTLLMCVCYVSILNIIWHVDSPDLRCPLVFSVLLRKLGLLSQYSDLLQADGLRMVSL